MDCARHLLLCLALAGGAGPQLTAQTTARIRLVQVGSESFRFEPQKVSARPGDVIEFTVVSGGPYVVGFEPQDFPGNLRERMSTALPGGSGPLRGPVLNGPGAGFRLVLPELPTGKYRFASMTHLAYRMTGVLTVP